MADESFLGGQQQFARGNVMAMLRKWVGASSGVYVGAAGPTSGTSGTFANFAQPGALYVDQASKSLYINQGTKASPNWAPVGLGAVRATYDFSVDGGAISAIGLGVTLPDNAIIVGGVVDVITTLTSATDAATIALSANSADDLVAAIAISNVANPWDAGLQAIIPKSNTPESTGVKLTAAREITATIAVEAVTAGKFEVLLQYYQSS